MTSLSPPTRWTDHLLDARLLVPLMMLLFAAVTGSRVFTAPLWGDELRTWRDGIEKPLWTVFTWRHNPDHSPLGHLLARGGAALFGVERPWALRLGAWLCGIACVPAIWWMGRTLHGTAAVGLLVAAMLMVDPNLIHQASQARMYSVLMLAAIVSVTLAGSILLRPERPWVRAVWLGIVVALGIWAHSQIYAVLLAILIVGLASSLAPRFAPRRAGAALLVAIVIACVLGAPGIAKIVSRHDAEAVESDVTAAPLSQLDDAVQKVTGKAGITVVVIGSVLAGIVVLARRSSPALPTLLLLVIAVALINLLVAARYRPVAHARYLTVMQPPMWLAMAAALYAFWMSQHRWTLGLAGALTTFGLSIFELQRAIGAFEVHPAAVPFAQATRYIASARSADARCLIVPRSPYAMYGRYYAVRTDPGLTGSIERAATARRARDRSAALAELNQSDVWLITVLHPKPVRRPAEDDPAVVVDLLRQSRQLPPPTRPATASASPEVPRWAVVVQHFDRSGLVEQRRFEGGVED